MRRPPANPAGHRRSSPGEFRRCEYRARRNGTRTPAAKAVWQPSCVLAPGRCHSFQCVVNLRLGQEAGPHEGARDHGDSQPDEEQRDIVMHHGPDGEYDQPETSLEAVPALTEGPAFDDG